MDPSLILYSAAIKIDYNVHRLDHITVEDNLADGVLVDNIPVTLRNSHLEGPRQNFSNLEVHRFSVMKF